MATVVGYFQSGPTHEGPNTKSVEVDEDRPETGITVDGEVEKFYELGAFCVEVDGEEVPPAATEEDEEAVDELGDAEPADSLPSGPPGPPDAAPDANMVPPPTTQSRDDEPANVSENF